jgi:GT2 family glycosyltransferase
LEIVNKAPTVSVIIPTRNRWASLKRLLQSVCSSIDTDLKNSVEVIIVDDASVTKPPQSVFNFRNMFYRFLIIRNEKCLGASASRNRGLVVSRGKYLLFVDDDVILPPNFISILANLLDKNDDVAMVGGIIKYLKKPTKTQYIAWHVNLTPLAFLHGNITYESVKSINDLKLLDADYIPTAFLVKREIAMKINGFDEQIPLYYDDSDFGYRIKKLGLKILINPNISVYHNAEDTIFSNPWKVYMCIRNSSIFMVKHSNIHRLFISLGACVLSIRYFFQILKQSSMMNFFTLIRSYLYITRGLIEAVLLSIIVKRG